MDIKSPADKIDKMTDQELDEFIASVELKCKVGSNGTVTCITPEEVSRAIARLKTQPARLVFEVTTEPAPAAPAEPVAPVTE